MTDKIHNHIPQLNAVNPDEVVPKLKSVLQENKATIEECLKNTNDWMTLMNALEETQIKVDEAWSGPRHLTAVMYTDRWQEVYNECLGYLSQYQTEMMHHKPLYDAVCRLSESSDANKWTPEQKRVVDLTLRDFRLSGVQLPSDQKKQLADISQKLAQLSSRFSENALKATQEWSFLLTDEEQTAGLPERFCQRAAQLAQSRDKDGWLITLDAPSFMGVMQYSEDRSLREKVYKAYVSRASELRGGAHDNGPVMVEILTLKKQMAEILGYQHYADYALVPKMAESVDAVEGLVHKLGDRSLKQAKKELDELKAFAKARGMTDELMPWDTGYWAEQLRQDRFQMDSEAMRAYFPLSRVVSGLFEIIKRLYGITLVEETGDLWHKDAFYWRLLREDGTEQGSVLLDLFAREGKRDGAWMDGCRSRYQTKQGVQNPVCFVVANFMPGVAGKEPLLSHQEVVTLFHEFGHALHHLLTEMPYPSIAGTHGVPWDAVELPSQFFEHWAWHEETLPLISQHIDTGETLPEDLLHALRESKNFNSAMAMMRQLEFSRFDFTLHQKTEYTVAGIQAVLDDVRAKWALMPSVDCNRFQNCFSHIFAGGYAAGYYSYKWAEVLSSDAFEVFLENGVFSRKWGDQFKKCILAKGGSEPASDLYRRFRGRDARIEALLKDCGIECEKL